MTLVMYAGVITHPAQDVLIFMLVTMMTMQLSQIIQHATIRSKILIALEFVLVKLIVTVSVVVTQF